MQAVLPMNILKDWDDHDLPEANFVSISQLKCKRFPVRCNHRRNSSGGILNMANIDIKFIAKKSGCSIATVSRVINRSKPVSEAAEKSGRYHQKVQL